MFWLGNYGCLFILRWFCFLFWLLGCYSLLLPWFWICCLIVVYCLLVYFGFDFCLEFDWFWVLDYMLLVRFVYICIWLLVLCCLFGLAFVVWLITWVGAWVLQVCYFDYFVSFILFWWFSLCCFWWVILLCFYFGFGFGWSFWFLFVFVIYNCCFLFVGLSWFVLIAVKLCRYGCFYLFNCVGLFYWLFGLIGCLLWLFSCLGGLICCECLGCLVLILVFVLVFIDVLRFSCLLVVLLNGIT